ncbi:hypothetical protein [Amycolatopsis sp. SID8362]|uniref:hypothetical protein n=1 Tax=Amycolatopsis sp. SID8362 TaxID=2690346 RepID=UPI00136F4045|nr:hypothetical protein [Amycolatopsis sp. SID8362]NBH04237.1 hypothetical protein [Amycolatopsis sp. SID8362]NED40936.1 hypothetical protein [Amycolatopsis sp. SID8362]
MTRASWTRDAEALFAASRRGVITVAHLQALGVPQVTSYRRCLPGGPWQRLLPGVVLLRTGVPTRRQLVEGALVYSGDQAVVTGLESCRRHGLKRAAGPGEPIHLLLPAHLKTISSGYVLIERTRRMPDPVRSEGLPLAPAVRAVLDECRRLRERPPIRALLAEAVQQLGIRPAELSAELELGSRRGTALPRAVLREITQGARSAAEADAMALWRRTGLPEPVWNFAIHDERGRHVATPDAWFDEVALAWEIDSYEFHFGQPGYATTLARNNRYAAAGIAVVQTLPSRLRTEPAVVAAELVSAYRAAAARPRPPVVLTARSE